MCEPDGRAILVSVSDECVNAATGTGAGDAVEPLDGYVAEVGWEIGNDQEAIRFGQLPRLLVIVVDGLEFVSQVFLDHRFPCAR